MNNNYNQSLGKWLAGIALLCLLTVTAMAEDTAIFSEEAPPSKPNILFILDHSGSMNFAIGGTGQSRLETLRVAFSDVMSDPELVDVNVGLMGFSNGYGTPFPHGVSFPISPIDDESTPLMLANLIPYGSSSDTVVGYFTLEDDTLPNPVPGERVREFLPRILDGWVARASTPIVDAYYEAALYFRGEEPKWGLATPEQNHAAHPSTYRGSSQGTISEVLTGDIATCDTPSCGVNCTGLITQDACSVGGSSCGLGTNCSTTTETVDVACTLGSEAACLLSDPEYASCTESVVGNCSNSCVSGVYHPETGECIADASSTFTIKSPSGVNMCLEVNNNTLSQEVCDGSAQQAFTSTEVRPGYSQILASNNFCLTILFDNLTDRAAVDAYACYSHSPANQAFQFSGSQIIAEHSGKCLNTPGGVTGPGSPIQQLTCTGDANQFFTKSNDATSCSGVSNISCQKSQAVTRCDHQKYSCDVTKQVTTLDSTAISYHSPIKDKCESNAIVLLSDGDPFVSNQAQLDQTMAEIKSMAGLTEDCSGQRAERCGEDLARFLSKKDQSPSIDGVNTVNTYTVGFDVRAGSIAERFLTGVAQAGGGNYFPASNAAALASVFKSIISDVSKAARSYAAPVYTVDPSTPLANSRDIYIPLFENSAAPAWSGNLKKFKLNDSGQIVDRNGYVAVSANGGLDSNAADFWSVATANVGGGDPNPVTSGGAANQLVPGSRNLLINDGNVLVALDKDSVSKKLLTGRGSNMSDELHTALVEFIQGYKSDGSPRNHIGDILHSKPTTITYANKEVIFFGTNEGYLHAINTADASTTGGGKELFAFMPSSLLANVQGQYENTPLTGSIKRIYGVDGEMAAWIQDNNRNGKIDGPDESAYLFFGLRRGGSEYYALDVTKPSKPNMLWSINNKMPHFSQLGQSWSKPTIGKLRYKDSGAIKFEDVLVFGGGYDAGVYDEQGWGARNENNVRGNGVYIVNAKTGKHIWSYEGRELEHSVPSSIRVLDIDNNGSIDRLYFGDVGGNVWRVDLNVDDFDDDASMHDVKKDANLYKFASLGQNPGGDNRKFFYEPEVSMFKHKGRLVSLLTIGSGYRAHPRNTSIQDSLFVLYDEHVTNIPDTMPQPLTGSDLTTPLALSGTDFLPNFKGWHKSLVKGRGEKSLSTPVVFMNKVMFTTFGLSSVLTSTDAANECSAHADNVSRAYALDLMSGAAVVDLDGDGIITDNDESVIVGTGDIPESPTLVFNKPSNCTNEGCDHIVDVRVGKMEEPLIDGSTVGGNVNLGEYLPRVYWLNPTE